MENYTFLKFIKIKENKNKKKIRYFKNQIGGSNTIDFKTIQLKLYNLEQQLKYINKRSVNTIINPYNILKNQIDEINNSINQLQKKSTIINDKDEILNKITDLKIILDSSPNDYTKIKANTTVSYVSETINTEQIALIFEKYIDDSNLMIDDIKKKIEITNGKLIKNTEILGIIRKIRSKMIEYNKNLSNFKKFEDELNKKIIEMIKLFNVVIDPNTTCEDPNKNDIIVNVDKISTDDKQLELDEVLKIAITEDEISELIGTNFLKEKPSKSKSKEIKNKYYYELPKVKIDETMTTLYQEWLNKVNKYKSKLEKTLENQNKLKLLNDLNYELIKIFPKLLKEYLELDEFRKLSELSKNISNSKKDDLDIEKLEKLYKDDLDILNKIKQKLSLSTYNSLIYNENIKKEIINKINEFLKLNNIRFTNKYLLIGGTVENESYKPEEDKTKANILVLIEELKNKINYTRFTNKYLLIGGTVENESYKPEEDKTEANILVLIEELKNYEKLVRDIKIYNIKLIKLVKLYNIRYSQFFNFQKYIVNYVSLTIAEGGYSYYQYMSNNIISFFNSLLSDLGNTLDKFNNYSNLDDSDREFLKKPHIKWFYGKHYFMIKILQNFFSKLYDFWSKKQEEEKSKPDKDKKWSGLLKNQIKTDKFNSNYFFLFNIFKEILLEYESIYKNSNEVN